jgi:exosome complex RNA-binding protein Rrp4
LIIMGYNGWIWMDGMDDGMYNKESDMIGGWASWRIANSRIWLNHRMSNNIFLISWNH